MDKNEEICRQLSEIIKSKSVFTTLNKILKGESKNVYFEFKGLLSLATHISIELEQGHLEYKPVLEDVFKMITEFYHKNIE